MKARHDLIIGILVIFLGFFIFFNSLSYSKYNRDGVLPLGPRFYPQLIGIGLFICGSMLALKHKPTLFITHIDGLKKNLKIILSFVSYVLIFEYLGYLLSTFLFTSALIYAQGGRKLPGMILFSAVVTISLYLIFQTLLAIPLPAGIFIKLLF